MASSPFWNPVLALWALPLAGAVSIWEVGKPQGPIETVEEGTPLPSPQEFWKKYLKNVDGPFGKVGKPALFKGAAKSMPAYSLWTDEYLLENYGKTKMDQVETEKKETRTKYPIEDWNIAKFLQEYTKREIYSTSTTPKGLSSEVELLPMINCGGYHRYMSANVMWFSSGDTKSVIHQDGQHNLHCMFAGKKDWILWDPREDIHSEAFGWVHAEREAANGDEAFKDAYGAYVGRVDPEDVDLKTYPGWDKLKWWNMTLEAGDCAYIPPSWFHYVVAPPQRSISVHVWFWNPKEFDQKSCDALESKGLDLSKSQYRISDCTFGFELGQKKAKKTRCKLRADKGQEL